MGSYCDHYYGQCLYTNRGLICCLLCVVPFLPAWIFQNGYFLLVIPVGLILFFTMPLIKMNADESACLEEPTTYHANFETEKFFRKNRYYFLNADFDDEKTLPQISPIRIVSMNKKSKTVAFYFLFDCQNNQEVLNDGTFAVYNACGQKAALHIVDHKGCEQ